MPMPQIVVDTDQQPDPNDALVSFDSLHEYLRAFCEGELFTDIPLEELLKETVHETSPTGRPIAVIPDYELRYDECKFSHSGIIGKCMPSELAMTVRAAWDHVERKLSLEQTNAQWRCVAVQVATAQVNRSFDLTGNVSAAGRPNIMELVNRAERSAMRAGTGAMAQGVVGDSSLTQAHVVERADHRTVLRTVWTDIAKAEIVDPISIRWPGSGQVGPMKRYAETNELRHLPRYLRIQRDKAKALLQRILDGERTSTVAAQDLPETTIKGMVVLRQNGMSYADIGKMFGMHHNTVKKYILEHQDHVRGDEDEGEAGGA